MMNDFSGLRFTGTYFDTITPSYVLGNGYRVYVPSLMRFSVPDESSPFDLGGINTYAYCVDDPVNKVDPSGHFALTKIRDLITRPLSGRRAERMDLSISAQRASEASSHAKRGLDTSDNLSGNREKAPDNEQPYLASHADDERAPAQAHPSVSTASPAQVPRPVHIRLANMVEKASMLGKVNTLSHEGDLAIPHVIVKYETGEIMLSIEQANKVYHLPTHPDIREKWLGNHRLPFLDQPGSMHRAAKPRWTEGQRF